jgi:transcriptional regulator with XRE-family HTH domain
LLRESAGLSVDALAEAADCSPGHLRQIETGLRQPSARLARRLARELTKALDRLVTPAEFCEDEPATLDAG